MTVVNVIKDYRALTMTMTAEFTAPVERVWQLWQDPRQLERWWGPPTYPATFVDLDLSSGGHASYFMTGPSGDKPRGWWRVLVADEPHQLEFENGFARDDGSVDDDQPFMTMRVLLARLSEDGTRMSVETSFPSPEAMANILARRMEEGLMGAMSQMDDLL